MADDETGYDSRHLTVPGAAAGERLDRWLAAAAPDLSRNRIKALVLEGRVAIEGRTVSEPSCRIKPGTSVVLTLPPPTPAVPEAQAIPLDIVYEDEQLLVVDKPAGMVVHPAPGSPDRTLVNALIAHCGDSLTGIGGVQRPGIVHRIDKDTSGLLVVAKSDAAHEGLARQFAEHSLARRYIAVVWGMPEKVKGTVEGNIGRHPKDRKRNAVLTPPAGKPAITHYRVLRASGTGAAMLECRLETGRTHQIRVHMASIGHPLIGDPLYGRNSRTRAARLTGPGREVALAFPRQALHAISLGFTHPTTHEILNFQSQIPTDIMGLMESLELNEPG